MIFVTFSSTFPRSKKIKLQGGKEQEDVKYEMLLAARHGKQTKEDVPKITLLC